MLKLILGILGVFFTIMSLIILKSILFNSGNVITLCMELNNMTSTSCYVTMAVMSIFGIICLFFAFKN